MPRGTATFWKWLNDYVYVPVARRRQRTPEEKYGPNRWTKNFRQSKKRRFIHTVVAKLGMTHRFHGLVKEYTQKYVPLAAAYVMALQEIGQLLKNEPDDIEYEEIEFEFEDG